jgi:hypothetical protein
MSAAAALLSKVSRKRAKSCSVRVSPITPTTLPIVTSKQSLLCRDEPLHRTACMGPCMRSAPGRAVWRQPPRTTFRPNPPHRPD